MTENQDNPKFPPLNLPPVDLRLQKSADGLKVFDPLRDKFVALTPEEYVRQHFTSWLIKSLHYPASNIANETGIRVNGTLKRCDTYIIARDGSPLMIVEYKAPGVNITQDTFDQIVRYNMTLRAKYLVVSNGLRHYCCVIDYAANSYHFIPRVPDYHEVAFPNSQN